jgi:OOP family OmpA-OmpF porin
MTVIKTVSWTASISVRMSRVWKVFFGGGADSDQDGIPNQIDKCPFVYGLAKYNGCPVADSDNDGINDDEDSCVAVAGLLKYHGCPIPDCDRDGTNDEEDSCLLISGNLKNHGCPEISQQVRERLIQASGKIYFKSGSDQLFNSSITALQEVIGILEANPVQLRTTRYASLRR